MWDRIPVAFAAGLVSVVTPCVLPLVPGYLSAISSVEASRLGEPRMARRVVVASLPFILGFTAVFVVLGAAAAAIGGIVNSDRQLEIAGFVLVVLGLVFMGLLPWPERVVAPGLLMRSHRTGSSLLLGGAFLDQTQGWLVGAGATALFTTDGGAEWRATSASVDASRFGQTNSARPMSLDSMCACKPATIPNFPSVAGTPRLQSDLAAPRPNSSTARRACPAPAR